MKLTRFISLFLLGVMLFSCKAEDLDEDFILDREVRMEVSGTEIFRYNPVTCQEYFNYEDCCYSVGTDTMSDFFSVRFNTFPAQEGQTVYGSIKWTTPTSISTRDNVALTAVKLEGGRIWLWSTTSNIGVVIRLLD